MFAFDETKKGLLLCVPAEARRYMLVACIACYVCENLSLFLLKDDRLLLHFRQIEIDMEEERAYIESIPLEVWGLLALLAMNADFTGIVLQDLVLCAMHVAWSFLRQNGLSQVKCLPLCLTQGDVAANVDDFARQAFPANSSEATQKIWWCARLDRFQCIKGLLLLRDCAFSVMLVEKSHKSGSNLRSYHKRLSRRTFQLRSN